MRDFFEAQKQIIIALVVIIAITIISGYFTSSQSSPFHDDIDDLPIFIKPSLSEPLEEESDSLSQVIPDEVSIANEREKTNSETRPAPQPQEETKIPTISANLIINEETYALSLPEQSSVYDLMEKAREVHGILFGGREYTGIGFFVDEINGVKNNEGGNSKYWIYSINGQKAQVGISQYILQDGDIISWNYEDEME